jgi:hypothetical protein
MMADEITDRFNSIATRIGGLPEEARLAVAVIVAQRLVDQYRLQPEGRRSNFVAPWAEMMPLLWRAVAEPSDELKRTLQTRLNEDIGELLGQEQAEYGQPKYEEYAGYACIAAVEAYCGNSKAAAAAASQLLADAQWRAQRSTTEMGEDRMSATARARVLRLRHVELDRLDNAVSLLEREGFSVALLPQLRDVLGATATA